MRATRFVTRLIHARFSNSKLPSGYQYYQRNMEGWNCLIIPSRDEVEISSVLTCGQSFRWKTLESDNNCWIGVFSHKVWILQQKEDKIFYKVFPAEKDASEVDKEKNMSLLRKYFQLDVSLKSLYEDWSSRDKEFAKLTVQDYRGIRILSQDCVENVFSFICSSNNNIVRISQMVEKLCTFYGDEIAIVEGKTYHDFPRVEKLTGSGVEKKLRDEKFGYRAGYIAKTASQIVENGGVGWLENLRAVGYDEARRQLQSLTGIGRKVADCICLMSMGYHQAIPIDTHMQQVAKKYLPHLPKTKTLTDKTYSEITECFRKLHGDYAGWAHSVLFASRLRHLKADSKTSPGSATNKIQEASHGSLTTSCVVDVKSASSDKLGGKGNKVLAGSVGNSEQVKKKRKTVK